MTEPYQRLQENQLDVSMAPVVPQAPNPTLLRYRATLFKLAVSELVLAILILVFGTTCVSTSLGMGMSQDGACTAGTGVWTGILAVVSASFGMVASKKLRNKCVLITFFILCIVSAAATGILFLVSVSHFAEAMRPMRYMPSRLFVTLVLNIILTLISFGHAICCIVSTSLLCCSWGCNRCCECCTETDDYSMAGYPNAGPNLVHIPHTGVLEQFGRNPQYILMPMNSNTTGYPHQPGSLVLQTRELSPLNPAPVMASNQKDNV